MTIKVLPKQESHAKDIMVSLIVPALNDVIKARNPKEYARWGGNCCRQTAVFGAYFLEKLLPKYDWKVYDGEFDDTLYGRAVHYNHAWIFGVNRADNRKLFVDLARIHTEQIFMLTENNRYPKDNPEYKDLKETSRTQLDWHNMIATETEYYTGLSGNKFIAEIEKRLL